MSLLASDECTKKCKSVVHGSRITAACSKREIDDNILAGFIKKSCRNFVQVSDEQGRTALHLAASTDKTALVSWLLRNGADANAKDLESGQTPLHRAIFYGSIKAAVILLQNNASVEVCDVDNLSALHYCLLASKRKPVSKRIDTETYAYGSNSHYNLGLDQGTQLPKCIEYFKRNGVSIKSVALSAFHSLFLAATGEVYSVGHGVGGRLGHGQESTLVQPQKLNLRLKRTDEKITSFSASKNHSLILTNLNYIYASGANAKGQLGVQTGDLNLLEFKNINCTELQDHSLVRVIALDQHSIAYSGSCLFAWGSNTGQLGLRSTEPIIPSPQLVLNGQQILLLDACNSGLAFYSGNKSLNVFSSYKMRFFKTPGLEVIKQLSITDAEGVLKVLVMTDSNQIYIWDDILQKYTKCYYSMCRQFEIRKLFWSGSKIMILAGEDIFTSVSSNLVKYNESEDVSEYQEIYSTKKDICQTNRIKINLRRIPLTSNVRDVWTDGDGQNCIFIRDDPYTHLKVPTIQDQDVLLDCLHSEMCEFDGIHDITFHVGREVYPAHKYVLLSRAPETFGPWIESLEDNKNCHLTVDGLTAKAFELILKIIYTNHILTEEDIQKVGGLTSFKKLMVAIKMGKFLEKSKKNMPRLHFDRNDHQDLWDVTINCASDRQLNAHKCILVSRLKYFNMMFSSSWMETSEVNFTTIPVEYCEVLLDFLYNNSASRLLSKKYTEAFITNMIVVADQLFCDRLKDIFQINLLKRYTMKRTAECLELAFTYHCDLLKRSIFDFICANLREVLESRLLDSVDLDYLSDLDERYREMFPDIKYRQVLPSPNIDEEYITACAVAVDLNADVNGAQKVTPKPAKEPKSATKRTADYEKEGKLSLQLKKEKEIEESPSKMEKNLAAILSDDSQRVLLELQEKNKSIWTKVAPEKKPELKRMQVVGALNANEVLRNEEKMTENFSNLKLALNGGTAAEAEAAALTTPQLSAEASPSQFNSPISFGDFFSPPSTGLGRMSQKQRKRHSSNRQSESEGGGSDYTAPPAPESVWNVPANNSTLLTTPPPDFGDTRKQRQPKKMINFDAILVEEKREREYFHKLKTKSLTLTQLEEAAMAELLAFYNADKVFDETIVIERKVRQQVSQSFSNWGRQTASAGDNNSSLEYVAGGGAARAEAMTTT